MIKRELRNIGINPIEELSVQERTNIAEKVVAKLVSLNIVGLSEGQILEKLFKVKMYRAQMRNDLGKVNYFYKNKTIYFDKNIDFDENVLRECIHYLQDKRDRKEKIKRMGLCTFEEYKVRGMALNEIGINYICNKLLNKYTKNKTFILLKQILLVTGEEVFLDSLLNNNSRFKEKFMEQTNSEVLYYKMQNTFDAMFDLEQIIKRLNFEGRTSRNPEKYLSKINMHKHTLSSKFSEIQWDIYNRYFSRKIELIDQIEQIKAYKNEIFNFNQWLEISEDELKYTNFVAEKFEKLDKIEMQILKLKANNSMVLVGDNTLHKLIRTIKKLFLKPKEYEEK